MDDDLPDPDDLASGRADAARIGCLGTMASLGAGLLVFGYGVLRLQRIHSYRPAMRFFDRFFYPDAIGTALAFIGVLLLARAASTGGGRGVPYLLVGVGALGIAVSAALATFTR